MRESKLIFLPGLGGDARLFTEQRSWFPDAQFPALPNPDVSKGFAEYAESWGDATSKSGPLFVVGFAFGGILALEAAKRSKAFEEACQGILLCSSCRTSSAVTSSFRRQVALSRAVPSMMVRRILMSFAERFSPEDDLTDMHRQMLRDMAAELNIDSLRWASLQICDWKFDHSDIDAIKTPIFQVHGERDSVIPCVPEDTDFVIPGAGHLIQYTHSGQLNAYIDKCRESVS